MRRSFTMLFLLLAITSMASAQETIQSKIALLGGSLGAPIGEERTAVDDGRVQAFENGTIYWSPRTGAKLVSDEILAKYNVLGGEAGTLGYPVTDEKVVDDVISQTFEHGFINYNYRSGDTAAILLDGVDVADGSLTVTTTNPVILGIDNDGSLIVRTMSGDVALISCDCAENPNPNPDQSDRLGLCAVSIYKAGKKANCYNSGLCNGTCSFTSK